MRKKTAKHSLEELKEKFREIHGNKYDYSSLTEYVNNRQHIYPICPEHGVFKIQVRNHLRGQKCCKCSGKDKMTTEKCVKLSKGVHGDKYDYSITECNGSHKPIKVICPKHGVFETTPHRHIYEKQGCRYCANERTSKRCRTNQEEIVKRINNLHPEWIIDEKFVYSGMNKKVVIKCPFHGYFTNTPSHIIYNNIGCPMCHSYSLEIEIEKILKENNIRFEKQKTFDWLVYKRPQSLDFYLPDYNLAIECQGIQHFKRNGFITEHKVNDNKLRDFNKYKLCCTNGVKILYYSDIKTAKHNDNDYMRIITDKDEILSEIYL